MDLGVIATVFLALATIATSFITSVTGMAGGALMLAAMNVVLPLSLAIPVHGAVQLVNNAARTATLKHHIHWSLIAPFAAGTVLGAVCATYFAQVYYHEAIPLLILVSLIGYTLFRPKKLPQIKIRDSSFFWVGLLTGAIGIIAGAIDPILAVFFMRDDFTKEAIVANKSLMQFIAHATKIPAFLYLGFSYADHLGLIVFFTVSALIGTWIGIKALQKVDQQLFFRLMEVALYVTGARLLYQLIRLGV